MQSNKVISLNLICPNGPLLVLNFYKFSLHLWMTRHHLLTCSAFSVSSWFSINFNLTLAPCCPIYRGIHIQIFRTHLLHKKFCMKCNKGIRVNEIVNNVLAFWEYSRLVEINNSGFKLYLINIWFMYNLSVWKA